MKDQRSRFYHRRNPPHGDGGRFANGTTLYTRYDGSSRWLRHFHDGAPDERVRLEWLSDEGARMLRHMFVILVAAFLVFWFW